MTVEDILHGILDFLAPVGLDIRIEGFADSDLHDGFACGIIIGQFDRKLASILLDVFGLERRHGFLHICPTGKLRFRIIQHRCIEFSTGQRQILVSWISLLDVVDLDVLAVEIDVWNGMTGKMFFHGIQGGSIPFGSISGRRSIWFVISDLHDAVSADTAFADVRSG